MFTRDEPKRKLNIKNHGLDFDGCDAIWDHFTITREDKRQDYGEQRLVCFGLLAGVVVVVVYTERAKGPHIISLPKAEKQKSMKLLTTAKLPKKTSAKVADQDNPAWTEDMLGAPVLKRGRGPQAAPTKVLTSIRLDADILEFFKAQGAGYQSRINDALRVELNRKSSQRLSPASRKRVAA